MTSLVLAVMFLGFVSSAFGQRRGPNWSLGGFGSVLYPGTGHAPVTPPGGVTGPNFFGRPISGSIGRHPVPGGPIVPEYPLPSPPYDNSNPDDQSGLYPQGNGDQAPAAANFNGGPPVVINQNLVPPASEPQFANQRAAARQEFGAPLSENSVCGTAVQASPNAARKDVDDKLTIYLIAFKDHSVVQALGYWIEGTMLHYVSVEYAFNQASLALIDPDLSQRLNGERGLDFKLTGVK